MAANDSDQSTSFGLAIPVTSMLANSMTTVALSFKQFLRLWLVRITIFLVAMSLLAYLTDNGNLWVNINIYTYSLLNERYKFEKFGYGNGFVWFITTNVIQFPIALAISFVSTLVSC